MSKLDHVCGLSGYCPGPPYYDPICPGCALRGKSPVLRTLVEACRDCTNYRLCRPHLRMAQLEEGRYPR